MTTRHLHAASALALTLIAGAASAMPASGEAPFFDGQASATAPSSLTRSAVVAMAIASPPAAGESSGAQTGAPTPQPRERTVVVAELAQALAHGLRPAAGEAS